ncbi:MAG: sodium:solute symporter [Planctomycetes bacterium]|nr:sodium:solute symporter [Planctomycetota bacterium]
MLYALAIFVLLQLGIGVLAARRITTEEDYLLAGRRVGIWLATASIFATWFGAESCLAAAGAAYGDGVSWMSTEPLAYGLCLLLLGVVFAGRFWRLRITTLPDYFRLRYGPTAERLAALVLLPSSILWAAAQIRAFGHIVVEHAGGGLGLTSAITIAAAVAIVYTLCGGLLADLYTDVVQGIVLVAGLIALTIAVAGATPPEPAASGPPPAHLPSGWSTLDLLEAWAIPICGSILAQEALSRTLAARSATIARNAAIAGGLLYLAIGVMPLVLGTLASSLLPALDEPESVLLRLSSIYLPKALQVVFLGALVAAILSTVDSCLLVAASLVARNLTPRLTLEGAARASRARIACAAAGILACLLALSGRNVRELIEEASGFGSAGIFVLAVVGLFTRHGNGPAAVLALAGGCAAWVAGRHVGPTTIAHPYLGSLAVAAVGMLLGCLVFRSRPGPANHPDLNCGRP